MGGTCPRQDSKDRSSKVTRWRVSPRARLLEEAGMAVEAGRTVCKSGEDADSIAWDGKGPSGLD